MRKHCTIALKGSKLPKRRRFNTSSSIINQTMKIMIKVPFDYKNACPDDIVDQLTNGWATYNDDSAVGYIDDTPVIFRWKGNSMVILFESKKEIEKCKPRLEEYIEDVKREQPTWIVDHDYMLNICLYENDED